MPQKDPFPAVRPLMHEDYELWRPVWLGNMQNQVSDEVTHNTWQLIVDAEKTVTGLGLFEHEKKLSAILHYVLHPTTGSLSSVCYMQDLFVTPECRRRGHARRLVQALVQRGRQHGWERIYWIAASENNEAQALYKTLGVRLNFSFHVFPLKLP